MDMEYIREFLSLLSGSHDYDVSNFTVSPSTIWNMQTGMEGVSGILCSVSHNVIQLMQYLYHTQLAPRRKY